ncbi:amidohydrolase [Rhizobium sp. Root1203]|uniref:amidohydrolase family protein n=1 Tax=Rhizobium sp. Root1203 TaxID=1736427 RepID=UPI00070A2A89|nr:amidohydrolase [Rhizobium sp. Root1203]KQV12308.1 amidohydrolase [Rhizobium sp. Root1203]
MSIPDIAIINATILPMGGAEKIENGSLTISGDSITAVGPAASVSTAGAKKLIDANDRVVMPGFVNCHTHIASNMLLRGLLEDVQLFEWLQTMWQLKRNFDEETLYWASLMGLVEMAKSGITTFNEHFDAYRVEPQIAALCKMPLRATLGYGLADRGLYAPITDWSWKALHRFGDKVSLHHRTRNDRVHVALSPHAPYSCGPEMFKLVRQVADAHKVVIHTHLSEGMQEIIYVKETYGTTPVQWVQSLGFLGPDVTAAHATQLNDDDIRILAETGTRIAHCPCCNAKLNSGTLRLRSVREAGIPVGLATDGPASHNALDMFQEMKFAGMIHKDKTGDVEFMKTSELLELATTGAAAAMNRPETGRLAVGRKADVIIVDLDKPHCMPVYDVAAALVYSARADDVVTTICDGQILMEDRVLPGIDETEIRHRFRERALALRCRSLN